MADSRTTAHFEVSLPRLDEAADEFGIWQAAEEAESFSARTGQPAVNVWRIDLPGDPEAARQAQAEQAARLARAEAALPDAARRLRAFVGQTLVEGAASYSSGLESDAPEHQPERALAAWVGEREVVSFGLIDVLPDDWQAVVEQTLAFFERVRKSLFSLSHVDTAIDGRRVGLTIIALDGDLRTAWGSGDETAAARHADNLALVLRARTNWLRMALLILRGGVQAGVLFPATPWLAVPAAYKFFKDVLKLAREMEPQPLG